MSTRENVIAAIAAKLVAANVASGRVYRSRQEAVVTLPAVNVEPAAESAVEEVLGLLTRTLLVTVNCWASGSPADQAADATVAAVEAAILADRSLGLGSEVQVLSNVETAWDFEDFDLTRIAVTFTVSLRTAL